MKSVEVMNRYSCLMFSLLRIRLSSIAHLNSSKRLGEEIANLTLVERLVSLCRQLISVNVELVQTILNLMKACKEAIRESC